MTPLNRRRFAAFRANKRGMVSLVVFGVLFFVSLFAEFLANDRPLLICYDGAFYSPMFRDYPETTFGGDFPTNAVYTDAELQKSIAREGLDAVAADPLQLRHRPQGRRPPGAAAAVAGRIRSAPTTRRATCWRG